MAQEIINIGAQANDGEGDPLRTAFTKVNNNFSQLFSTAYNTAEIVTYGNTAQEIFSIAANAFTQGTFQINSVDPDTLDSQNITITAAIKDTEAGVTYSGHSTLFNGNAITQYSMIVADGNVMLLVQPFITGQMVNFLNYQVTYNNAVSGMSLLVNQSSANVLGTEYLQPITTQQAS
jgi:hypothetical protein